MQSVVSPAEINERLAHGRAIMSEAVRLANKISRKGFETSLKQSERDRPTFLTEADKAIEALIVKKWLHAFPSDGIIGEEDGVKGRPGDSRVSIVIDPIDGTVPFSRGIKTYAFALAICVDRVPVAAVVHTQDQTFSANVYMDALQFHADGEPVTRMLDPVSSDRWVVVNEMFHKLEKRFRGSDDGRDGIPDYVSLIGQNALKELWEAAGQHVCFGSAIGAGIMVATGQVQAYVNPGVCLWDVAPLVPFAKAAGLKLTRWNGQEPFPRMYDRVLKNPEQYAKGPQCFDMLMAAPAVHEKLLPITKKYALSREALLYGENVYNER